MRRLTGRAAPMVLLAAAVMIAFGFTLPLSQDSFTSDDLVRLDPRLHGAVTPYLAGLQKAIVPTVVKATATRADGTSVYSVVAWTEDPASLVRAGLPVNSVWDGFATLRADPQQLAALTNMESVRYIDAGETYYPANDLAAGFTGADLLNTGYVNNTAYTGSGVIVCIIDTGIDWGHLDFRDPVDNTQSRILYIWDQTLTTGAGEITPQDRNSTAYSGLNYGAEYSRADIEDEIDGSPAAYIRQTDTNGHGTHVAGTAAGNGAALSGGKYAGMAPDADLLIIKAGNGSFPTANLIDALSYAAAVAEEAGKPIVVNMSLGGHANAHDGTRELDQAVDSFTGAGKIAVISAGNEGSDNIHISGSVGAAASVDFTFPVPAYTASGGTDNDYFGFDLWFDTGGAATATITSPNSYTATQAAGSAATTQTNDGAVYLYNYINVNNSDREVYAYIYDIDASYPPAAGTWTLTITNNSGSTMSYDGWLYGSSMGATLNGGDSDYTVGSPGTANEAITVGSWASRWYWSDNIGSTLWYGSSLAGDFISSFSSIGPTRDGRTKPDIAAPGQGIASSTSSDYTPSSTRILPGQQHHLNQGTSMSAPVAAGCAALLLDIDGGLTDSEVKSLITSTAIQDGFTGGSLPDYTWGYGKLDIYRAAEKLLDAGSAKEREILAYDEWVSYGAMGMGQGVKFSVEFTPSISCRVTGLFFHPYTSVDISSPLSLEIWSDDGSGLPAAKLGNTVTVAPDEILPFSWNYADMTGSDASVTAGTSYHAVLYYASGTTFQIFYDNGTVDNRSSTDTGGGWAAFNTGDFYIRPVISSDEGTLLAVNCFLEGPYDAAADAMITTLNTDGVIPTTSPYAQDARTVSAIPEDITDWVLVQLRETVDGAAVFSRSAFLHKDGYVVADNGVTQQLALTATAGSYYLLVLHRNHIAVMSDETVTLSTSALASYDFTTGTDKYYGTDAALLETGVYGLYAGDADGNNQVQNSDKNDIWKLQVGLAGYRSADFDLNGQVQNSDKNDIWKANVGKGTQVSGL